MNWVNRIAAALEVEPDHLVGAQTVDEVAVTAVVVADGARSPNKPKALMASIPTLDAIAVWVGASVGEYRVGDEVWCHRIVAPADYWRAVNLDILLPLAGKRFLFARLIKRDEAKLHVVPIQVDGRPEVVDDPEWLAVVKMLVRKF